MKKILFILTAVSALALCTSCGKTCNCSSDNPIIDMTLGAVEADIMDEAQCIEANEGGQLLGYDCAWE